MKIVFAIDSFKGSLSSVEAGTAAAEGARRVFPDAECVVRPLADGGEGVPLVKGDCVRICKSQNSVLLAETGARSFYENAFEKLTGLF